MYANLIFCEQSIILKEPDVMVYKEYGSAL
jgi:hypothetical protein